MSKRVGVSTRRTFGGTVLLTFISYLVGFTEHRRTLVYRSQFYLHIVTRPVHLVHRSYSVSVFISIIGDAVWDCQNKT